MEDSEKNEKEESKKAGRTHWTSIYVASALSFVGSIQFSLYFSALWPYMRLIDKNITEDFYGLTVAVYSLGQVISAPLFGAWSNVIKQVRIPLMAGLMMMLIGNIIYLVMESVIAPKRYILLICRFITGMGSGNVALLRSYASTASHNSDRSRAIAFVTCGQAIGMTIGPAFQYVFTPFLYPGPTIFNFLHLNLYTLPAYLAILINLFGIAGLYTLFVEKYEGVLDETLLVNKSVVSPVIADQPSSKDSLPQNMQKCKLPMYDSVAVLVCYATRFVDMFVRSQLETLGSPFSMMMFSLNEQNAVRYLSMAQGIVGFITLIVYIGYIFGNLERWINFRAGCIASLLMMFLFHFVSYAWPLWPDRVTMFVNNGSANNGTPPIGCDLSTFDWCANLPAVSVWVYYGAYVFFIGISFPLLTITLTTLFSRILGPRRQGTQQGFFQASSALARMIGPLVASFIYSKSGPQPVWIMEMAVIGAVLGSWLLFYTRMVALRMPLSLRKMSFVMSKSTKIKS